MHVLILCFNRLLSESLARVLGRAHFQVTAPQPPVEDSHDDLMEVSEDVLVLDSLQLLGRAKIFAPDHPESRSIRCVLIAMHDDQERFLSAIRLGALGYVLQEASSAEVMNAVRKVAQGEAIYPHRYTRALFDYYALQPAGSPTSRACAQSCLTRREQQLIPLIDRGMTNKEIASQLSLSEQTVKNHVHRILRKVGVPDRLSIFKVFQGTMEFNR